MRRDLGKVPKWLKLPGTMGTTRRVGPGGRGWDPEVTLCSHAAAAKR